MLDIEPVAVGANHVPIILGRPFLATSNAIINCRNGVMQPRIKISVNTNISVNEFYENIGNIGKISVDIFTKISIIKIFHILII